MTLPAFTRSHRPIATVSTILALAMAAAAPASAALAQDTPPPPAASGPAPSGPVQSGQLSALDLWSAPGADTGLPSDLWRGASGELAAPVLAAADKPLSPAMAALARRVLSTGASAPDGAGADAALAAARARALLSLGDAAGAARMLSRTPRVDANQGLSRVKAEAALVLGHDDTACETAAALQDDRENPWQAKLRIYCHLVAGEAGAAQIGLDLWRQQGAKEPAFDRLATAAANELPAGAAASLSDPLNYALSRRLGLDLAPALGAAHPAVLAAVARDPALSPAVRAAAAARALRLGLITGAEARAVLAPQAAASLGSASPAVADGPAPAPDVLLASKAAGAADPMERRAAVAALLAQAKAPADFQAVSRLVAPWIVDLVNLGAPLDDPALFAAAAAAGGETATAQTIRSTIEQDKAPASSALDLALLDAVIAAASGAPAGPALDRLIERGGVGDPKARTRAQGAALLLAATGQPMSSSARAQLAGFDVGAAKAPAPRLAMLSLARTEHRRGEAALLALSVAQGQPQGLSVADRAEVVAALNGAGLVEDARAVALEGLVALLRP